MLNDLLAKNQSSDKLFVEDVFSTWLYTGTGANITITNGVNLAGKGGLVWLKDRTNAGSTDPNHYLTSSDTSFTKSLYSNATSAAINYSPLQSVSSTGYVDKAGWPTGNPIVSWTFRKAPKFFDVVTYTGTGSARTINHNLGVEPGMIIVKKTSASGSWPVYSRALGYTKYLFLDLTFAATVDAGGWHAAPTASNFSVGAYNDWNQSGQTYVAYLFAHDTTADGVIQCGSYTTDGSAKGSVTLGWEPQYIIAKASSGASDWSIADVMRGASNTSSQLLSANSSGAEYSTGSVGSFIPNATGFTDAGSLVANGTVIYLAIRRGPMRTPTDGTKVYTAVQYTASAVGTKVTNNFPSDWTWLSRYQLSGGQRMFTRLTGSGLLTPYSAGSETNMGANDVDFDSNTQITDNYIYYNWGTSTPAFEYSFRRSPGFFDVVCYTGTGTNDNKNHNLSVVPELVILKSRSSALSWYALAESSILGGSGRYLVLDSTAAYGTGVTRQTWTSSTFSVGSLGDLNGSGTTYVAYLFATCPGVSKVGTYTGTGTTLQINCGFTNGARFVLIKRTDSTGDWYLYDSTRGISAGNDPYLLLNSTAAEVTNTDYIDPISTGFELSSTAPAALNANGGTYIYLAIA